LSLSSKRKEGEGSGDDGLEPLFPSAGGTSSGGFNFFSQAELTDGLQPALTGMDSLDS
jgi:hypothetical protein